MYDVTAGQQINYFKVVNATQNIDEAEQFYMVLTNR